MEELQKKGKEKASVASAIMKMIRKRIIIAVILTFLFSAFAILGPVRRKYLIKINSKDGFLWWI